MNRRQFLVHSSAAWLAQQTLWAAPTDRKPLRVLSFNLRYINSTDTGERTWIARRDQVAQVIRENRPDLIGYQEALRPMLNDLKERIPGYLEIGVGREDGKTRGEYSALLIREQAFAVKESGTFWLSDTPEIPNSMTWKNRVTRICTWAKIQPTAADAKPFYFYNCHLDHESQEAREKGVALILDHMSKKVEKAPVIFTGDFNAGEKNPAIEQIRSHALKFTEAWRVAHPQVPASESGTMHTFTGAKDKAKIDHIFTTPMKVVQAEIIHANQNGNYPSDHFPIWADLELP
jgi:endonuclease/exonuclease/phosphatase family metal-dependent hydrolase